MLLSSESYVYLCPDANDQARLCGSNLRQFALQDHLLNAPGETRSLSTVSYCFHCCILLPSLPDLLSKEYWLQVDSIIQTPVHGLFTKCPQWENPSLR